MKREICVMDNSGLPLQRLWFTDSFRRSL